MAKDYQEKKYLFCFFVRKGMEVAIREFQDILNPLLLFELIFSKFKTYFKTQQ